MHVPWSEKSLKTFGKFECRQGSSVMRRPIQYTRSNRLVPNNSEKGSVVCMAFIPVGNKVFHKSGGASADGNANGRLRRLKVVGYLRILLVLSNAIFSFGFRHTGLSQDLVSFRRRCVLTHWVSAIRRTSSLRIVAFDRRPRIDHVQISWVIPPLRW
jgi:hypothetical protein